MLNILEALKHPIVPVLTAIVSYTFGRWQENKKSQRSADTATYQHLKSQLPSFDHVRYFFDESTLTNAFSTDTFHKFGSIFEGVVANPEKHFLDKKLQADVVKIADLYKKMAHVVAIETFPVPGRSGEQTIRRQKYGDATDDMATGEKLNKMASEVYETYTALLKKIKSKLHISAS